jgi:hypothetical protein
MSSFGKGLKRTSADTSAPAPKMAARSHRESVPLEDLDLAKLEFCDKVETGGKGDRFVKLLYDGGRLDISLAKPPNFVRAPFAAGPPKTGSGEALGTSWGMVVELTVAQYEKWVAFEAHVIKKLTPLRNELFPIDAAKKKGGLSEESFADKFNTKVKPPNPDQGYPANLRIHVEDDETKSTYPNIDLMQLLGQGGSEVSFPETGSIHDLKAKCALAPVITLSRGVYAGNNGLGCKFSLASCAIFTNMEVSNAPKVDYSGVTFVKKEPAELVAQEEEQNNSPIADGAEQFEDNLNPLPPTFFP